MTDIDERIKVLRRKRTKARSTEEAKKYNSQIEQLENEKDKVKQAEGS
jgi:hypothetical protein